MLGWRAPLNGNWLLDRERLSIKVITNLIGISLFSLGIIFTLQSGLGLGPWDVLNQGISRHTPLSFGQASQAVSAAIIVVNLAMRVWPGIGTLTNSFGIGFLVDRINGSHLVPAMSRYGLPAQLAMSVAGVLTVGIATGIYIRADLGAGPRDGLMLGLHRLTGQSVARTRGALELSAATAGFFLGGTLGIGTIIFALGIGPVVQRSFRLFGVPTQRRAVEVANEGDPAPSAELI
jgi:uncharacterized membrane protein YczE